jgi:hypothetical protein
VGEWGLFRRPSTDATQPSQVLTSDLVLPAVVSCLANCANHPAIAKDLAASERLLAALEGSHHAVSSALYQQSIAAITLQTRHYTK